YRKLVTAIGMQCSTSKLEHKLAISTKISKFDTIAIWGQNDPTTKQVKGKGEEREKKGERKWKRWADLMLRKGIFFYISPACCVFYAFQTILSIFHFFFKK